jgi:hypothetical protein
MGLLHPGEPAVWPANAPATPPEPVAEPAHTGHPFGPAFNLLLQAYDFVKDLGCDRWEFAVEIHALAQTGLTINDIRWLLHKGYAVHAEEVTDRQHDHRVFIPQPGLVLSGRTCLMLTDLGVGSLRATLGLPATAWPPWCDPRRQPGDPAVEVQPSWDSDRQELRVAGVLVKEFKVPAPNQEIILSTFQEERWPPRIDDPLSPACNLDPKRRLHDTINSLNRRQKNRLLRFMGDGSGEGVRWQLLRTSEAAG